METKKTSRKRATTTSTKKKSSSKKTSRSANKKSGSTGSAGKSKTEIDVQVDGRIVRASAEIGGRSLILETGRMAKLADGAVMARYGDTMILATAQSSSGRPDLDFFPLTVDYRERYPAAGKFPGGFFKREGRPTTREVLTCRIIDRSIRPLFPDGFKKEVQVLSQVLSADMDAESDILAAVGSFAALAISSIPHEKHLGACRIGRIDGEFVINPTWAQLQSEENELNLTVAGHDEAVVMVEAGCLELEEDTLLDAIALAKETCADIAALVTAFTEAAGKEKMEWDAPVREESLDQAIEKKFGKKLKASSVAGADKHERGALRKELMNEVHEAFAVEDGEDAKAHKKYVSEFCSGLTKQGERDSILSGKRADGRKSNKIRPITIEVGILPKVHGSALFTRGETQAMCVATLGTPDDVQNRDGIYPEDPQSFMLHYTFPPFCVGEVRRMMGVSRREIGHGNLAERSVLRMLPPKIDFPYTMRVTSEILESNGSSSMASICGGTLALMDAGVPLRQPVAGIAMGLVMEGEDYAILSDILGSEDHCGDMDFKVAGTGKGITALQMDIKCDGLTHDILEEAMEQAKVGRLHILREMLKALAKPRSEISPNAPRLLSVQVPVEKIGFIIGPSGKNIRALQADYEVKISIDDTGLVNIGGFDAEKAEACRSYIGDMTREVKAGELYQGRVTSIKDFGCFVEILPGQEGLCHVSELSNSFIHAVTDVVSTGDTLEVKVLDIDDFGKIKLSHKATLGGEAEPEERVFRRGRGDSVDDYESDEGDSETESDTDEGADEAPRGRSDRGRSDRDGGRGPSRPREDRSGGRPGRDYGARGDDRGDRGPRGGRDRGERSDRGPRRDRDDRPDRGPRRDSEGRSDRGPRRDRDDRPDRGPRRDSGGRSDRGERSDRGPRRDRDDRPDRGERSERGPRPDRENQGSRGERSDRDDSGRGSRDRDDRESRGDRSGGRQDRGDRYEREPRRGGEDRDGGRGPSRPREDRSGGRPGRD
ncbi:MAG: polyribonucleotide nucleotidyltransferase, partial [Planctomycetota bacterium]|nr:polyribonucleotide nucleotidyltransferase [Planctomycetota bacterium]